MGKLVTPADVLRSASAAVSGTATVSATALGAMVSSIADTDGSGDVSRVPRWTNFGNITAIQGIPSAHDFRNDVVNYQVGDIFSFPNGLPSGWNQNVNGYEINYDGVGPVITAPTDFSVRRDPFPPDLTNRIVATVIVEQVRADAFGILKNDLFNSQVSPYTFAVITQPVGANPPIVSTSPDGTILIDATNADVGSYFAEYDLEESSVPASNNPGRIDITVGSIGEIPFLTHGSITAAGYDNVMEMGTFASPNPLGGDPWALDPPAPREWHDKTYMDSGTNAGNRDFNIEAGYPAYYYDASYACFNIADWIVRTGYSGAGESDPAVWIERGHSWAEGFIDYLEPSYNVAGYRVFGQGIAESAIRGGGTRVTQAQVVLHRDNGNFSQLSEFTGSYDGRSSSMSREVAYRMILELSAEKTGEARRNGTWMGISGQYVEFYLNWMKDHFNYWINIIPASTGTQRYAPFMAGLNVQALTYFYEWEVANSRDPNALLVKDAFNSIEEMLEIYFDYMWNDAEIAVALGGGPVGTKMRTTYRAGEFQSYNQSTPGTANDILPIDYVGFYYEDRPEDSGTVQVYQALNVIIGHGAAFVGKHKLAGDMNATSTTGEEFIDIADQCITSAWATAPTEDFPYGGKQTNQPYYGLYDYFRWRNDASGRND